MVYRARESQEWDARAASVAGGYLVAVTLADDEEGERYRVPFELQIGLQGTASGQEPTYADGRRPIGPAWPARPSAHEGEGDRVAPERGTAMLLGGSGLVLFVAGAAGLVALRRTRPRS